MEPGKGDSPKLPDMVMCGDHPSFIKAEVCSLEDKDMDKDKDKDKEKSMSFARIMPTTSHTEDERSERASEHTLRLVEARRRVRSSETMRAERSPEEGMLQGNKAMLQAALGSFRWPPYLVAVWVAVLVLTHALHCLVALLERALPSLRRCCQYFRAWAEECWRGEAARPSRALPPALAAATALLYALYFCVSALYSAAVWAIEPLLADDDKRDFETKVHNYLDEVGSRTNTSSKH